MSQTTNGKLTWDEVKRAYPNQWVVLVDLDFAENQLTLLRGRVVDHDISRKAVYSRTKPDRPVSMAIRFTGPVGVGSFLFSGKSASTPALVSS